MSNEDKPKKVCCPRPGCKGIVAHIYGKKMVSVKRSNNMVQNIGDNYNMVISCPFKDCITSTSITCENGQIKMDNLKLEETEKKHVEENKEDIQEDPKVEKKVTKSLVVNKN